MSPLATTDRKKPRAIESVPLLLCQSIFGREIPNNVLRARQGLRYLAKTNNFNVYLTNLVFTTILHLAVQLVCDAA